MELGVKQLDWITIGADDYFKAVESVDYNTYVIAKTLDSHDYPVVFSKKTSRYFALTDYEIEDRKGKCRLLVDMNNKDAWVEIDVSANIKETYIRNLLKTL